MDKEKTEKCLRQLEHIHDHIFQTDNDVFLSANQLAGLDILKRFSFQLVISSTLATDTFLMIRYVPQHWQQIRSS